MKYQLELRNISKSYGDLKANDRVNLKIARGSIHALLGENGAGKSTLVNILYGLVVKDEGQIFWRGEEIVIGSPVAAKRIGIGIVFQHFALFQAMTVVENIFLGINYRGTQKQLIKHIRQVAEHYQLDIEPESQIANLSAGEMQRVEIIRCLLQKPELLILDEPTSVLTPVETQNLFVTLRRLQKDGCSILFIGHKLDEIKELCEYGTVMRQGKWVGDCVMSETSIEDITRMMVDTQISAVVRPGKTEQSNLVLRCQQPVMLRNNEGQTFCAEDLKLHSGVITGIAGIAGNGQDALMSFLAGEQTGRAESLELEGQPIGHWSVHRRNREGILFVPTERLGRSAVTQMSLLENSLLGVGRLSRFVRYGLINFAELHQFCRQIIEDFSVRANGSPALASSLSGGNLQKFIVGRAIVQHPRVLLISNPTWGVDISAAVFIRNQLLALREAGVAILVASEDLDEMFSICDEIGVIKKGRLQQVQPVDELSVEKIGSIMTE